MAKQRKVRVARLDSISACRHELGKIYKSCRHEELDLLDAVRLGKLLQLMIQAFRDTELEERITQLEAHANKQQGAL